MDRIFNPDQVDDDRMWTEGDFALDIEATPIAAKYQNDVQEELCAVATMDGDVLDPNDQTQLRTVIARRATKGDVQRGLLSNAVASGTADALIATFDPPMGVLVDGMVLSVRTAQANTSDTPTFTPNPGLIPPKTIMKGTGDALAPGDIHGGDAWVDLRYSSAMDAWLLLGSAGSTCLVEVFDTSGTYIKPPGAKSIHLLLIGGGGGGASGRTGDPSAQINGGGAGSGAARVEVTFEAGIFPASCAVIVGEKGIGGAPSNDGNFRSATDGGMTSIDINGVFVTASGGFGAISSANRYGPTGLFPGGNAGAGGSTLGPGNPGNSASGAPGGGGGGGLANGSDWNGGGAERSTVYGGAELIPSGTGGIAPGGDGMDAKTDPLYSKYIYPGISGGGGASSLTSNGGDGGDGGGYGAGGGGGGAAATGFLSGAGGDGAPGVLVITTYF